MAESDNLWEQRIAIVSTWMLREVGKKNKETLVDFLEIYKTKLPRTSLRYAIEHFDGDERAYFMKK
ncbi:hypothetical protein AwDysgo_20840 [Bacteroidales bacterium]|nr:hypothetical protein AwDysgo_20840 [Bacteroidales bacterium]